MELPTNPASAPSTARSAVRSSELLSALRLAVAEKREAKRHYDQWYDNGGARRMETTLECALRTKLGEKTRDVLTAAEALVDAANDPVRSSA